jgi:hypothetical protein
MVDGQLGVVSAGLGGMYKVCYRSRTSETGRDPKHFEYSLVR